MSGKKCVYYGYIMADWKGAYRRARALIPALPACFPKLEGCRQCRLQFPYGNVQEILFIVETSLQIRPVFHREDRFPCDAKKLARLFFCHGNLPQFDLFCASCSALAAPGQGAKPCLFRISAFSILFEVDVSALRHVADVLKGIGKEGFAAFLETYKKALPMEKAAIAAL